MRHVVGGGYLVEIPDLAHVEGLSDELPLRFGVCGPGPGQVRFGLVAVLLRLFEEGDALADVFHVGKHPLAQLGPELGRLLLLFPRLVPVVYLQRYQNPDHHQQDLPDGIQQVFAGAVFGQELLAEGAEEFHRQGRLRALREF